LLLACSDGAKEAGFQQGDPTSLSLDPDARPDTGLPDSVDSDVAATTSPPDSTGESDSSEPTDTGPPPTGLLSGASCAADSECAIGLCLATVDGRQCATACTTVACGPGLNCQALSTADGDQAPVCVDRFVALCQPCLTPDDCAVQPSDATAADDVNACLSYGSNGAFCGVACGIGLPTCPDGYACGQSGQCRLVNAICGQCTALSVESGATTTCVNSNAAGSCPGSRTCPAAGPSVCDAPAPSAEICNGIDDDCDGVTDENPASAGCGDYACGGGGCLTTCDSDADCAVGLGCDIEDADQDGNRAECLPTGLDGSVCGDTQDCDSGYCANGFCCAGPAGPCCNADADCATLDETPVCTMKTPSGCNGTQTVGRCVQNTCQQTQVAAPQACLEQECRAQTCNGTSLSAADRCGETGECMEVTPSFVCDDADACTFDSCSPSSGCLTAPRTGASGDACYSGDPVTRGVGECRDGVAQCLDGVETSCQNERVPATEQCNGRDDDCDGMSDEDLANSCFPYACGGAQGCRAQCAGDGACADGAFCASGVCQSIGAAGAPCSAPSQCASGYCTNGFCCTTGLCCGGDDVHCDVLDQTRCNAAEAGGCDGVAIEGVCGDGFTCTTESRPAPEACESLVCSGGTCDGETLSTVAECNADGACVDTLPPTSCAPYVCVDDQCLETCINSADCAGDGVCESRDGVRGCYGDLEDGNACGSGTQCASGYCDNGFCCTGGTCCGGDDDCAAISAAAICDDAGACEGHRVDGVCQASKSCVPVQVDDPSGCLGQVCGNTSCEQLDGGSFSEPEGIRKEVCDGGGACVDAVTDCRELGGNARCTNNSSFYFTCANCQPRRTVCLIREGPCFCE
jgi:hypothetical protein